MSSLEMPMPRMEPIMVCELEAGRPRSQVARFQRIAATSRAKIMEKPMPWLVLSTSWMGSSEMMV